MAAPKYRAIMIANKGNTTCLIRVDSQKSNMTEMAYNKAFESAASSSFSNSSSNSSSSKTSASGGYGGFSASASHEQSQSNSHSASGSQAGSSKASSGGSWKVAFSPFLSAGYVQIKPSTQKKFTVEGQLAYISACVVDGAQCFINNWPTDGSQFVFQDADLNEVAAAKPKVAAKPKQPGFDPANAKTLRAAMVNLKFRTSKGAVSMSDADVRNTVIVELSGVCNESIPHIQGYSNDVLLGKIYVAYSLLHLSARSQSALKQMSTGDARNTLIVELNKRYGLSVGTLQKSNDKELAILANR